MEERMTTGAPQTDAQGNTLTGASPAAAARFDAALRGFTLAHGDSLADLDAAIAEQPAFAMAHLCKAWFFALSNDSRGMALAGAFTEQARGLPMNDREAAHLAALDLMVGRRPDAAQLVLDRLLLSHPRDLLAHGVAFLIDQFGGRSAPMRQRLARALPHWSTDTPGHAALQAWMAFGLEEGGHYAQAEDLARAVTEREPLGFWGHHTVAHVMEMMGRPEDGLGWMFAREPLWSSEAHYTRVHIWWHRALFHMELGQFDAAMALYDGQIRETVRPLAVSLTNPSALLWRLDLAGHAVGDRWTAEAESWADRADGRTSVFADLHALLAELGAGREAEAERRIGWMREAASADDEVGACYRDVGVGMGEALMAFRRARYAEAAEALFALRQSIWRIGGSHAQRDVFEWTLTEAAIRGGLRDMATALAHERLAARPRSLVNQAFLRRAERV